VYIIYVLYDVTNTYIGEISVRCLQLYFMYALRKTECYCL